MADIFQQMGYAVDYIIQGIAMANEAVLLNLWIVSPPEPPTTLTTSIFSSIVYGLLEPLTKELLQWSTVRPWLYVIGFSTFAVTTGKFLEAGLNSVAQNTKMNSEEKTLGDLLIFSRKKPQWPFYLLLVMAVQCVAALNASLLLLSQNPTNFAIPQIVRWICVICFSVAQIANCWISNGTSRPLSLGKTIRGTSDWLTRAGMLCLLLMTKLAVRLVLGTNMYGAFNSPSVLKAIATYDIYHIGTVL